METFHSQSMLETLPDEILLQICKYLLCSDILYSFYGLNDRMTQMITQYRHHLSFHRTSLPQFDYLCSTILPQSGSNVRSLVIDDEYCHFQDELFLQYFGENMPIIFPQLERISLTSCQYNGVIKLLNALNDMSCLVEIRFYGLYTIKEPHEKTFLPSLFQANNHRLTTILFDELSSSFIFDDTNCYTNIVKLKLKLKTSSDLLSLFAAVPNIEYLDVVVDDGQSFITDFDEKKLIPLFHLTFLRLENFHSDWSLEELKILFTLLVAVRYFSLSFCTTDKRLLQGNIILSSLPSTVEQFDYGIRLFDDIELDPNDDIVATWPTSHPIVCYSNDDCIFIHTVPYHFTFAEYSCLDGKIVCSHTSASINHYRQVETLILTMKKDFYLNKFFTVLSQLCQVRMLIIILTSDDIVVKSKYV